MKVNCKHLIILVVALLFGGSTTLLAQELTALEIITKADEKGRGSSSEQVLTLTIVRPDWSRSLGLKSWSKGVDYSLIYITSPAKEKGQVFLKRQKDMWNWVPSIERMIKIPPSMMTQSWMGSDFTNDDLVKVSSVVVDYTHTLLGKELIRGVNCYKLELIPLPDAAVTWGKLLVWVTVDDLNNWKTEYYDEDMELVNSMNCFDVKLLGDRMIPTRMEIEPANKKGHKTVIEIVSSTFNKPIADSFFSQQNMKSIK